VLAANADSLFILLGLEHEPNLRKIERYLAVARQSGAEPVVLLNKADLYPSPEKAVDSVKAISGGAAVLAISAETGAGCRALSAWLKRGKTIALLGPSGAGKSTLVNRLMSDEVQITQEVRLGDSKGRHTTTRRELFVTPSGALLLDTPGLRELQVWAIGIEEVFPDIAAIALRCRFSNCSHQSEPGCAIQTALASGELPAQRWDSYNKLLMERAVINQHLAARPDKRQKIVWKKSQQTPRPRISPLDQHD
jgi:ribosome biogenesis GTPase